MDSPWGEWRGATVAPPWHLHSRRSEMAGRQGQHGGDIMAQYGEASGRRVDRVATGRLGGGRLPTGSFAGPYTFLSCGYF